MIQRLHLKALLADRGYLFSLVVMVLIVITMIVTALMTIQPSELRIPVKYSRFDAKNYTLDQWYELSSYIVFALVVFAGHFLISARLYQLKGRVFALGFAALGSVILGVAFVYFIAIIRVVSLTQ